VVEILARREKMSSTITPKTILIAFDQFLARLFLIAAALVLGLMILALPPEGLFFALPFLLFLVAAVLGFIGSLFLLAVRGLRRGARWCWLVQIAPFVLLGGVLLAVLEL
jgi:hypothetical protein